ncbi:MAG: acyl-CoA thioesterase, partial [Lentihominibacter sp.]
MWEYRRRVRYYETDKMGVVHHSNYLRLIEDARMDWIGDHVMNYNDMEKMGVIIPVVNASGNFRAFLRYDDLFSVKMELTK